MFLNAEFYIFCIFLGFYEFYVNKIVGGKNMRKISVEVEQLESCAARMEEKNQDYLSHCNALFACVETMQNVWKGQDNTAFTNRISAYESDFRQLHMLASQYVDFLRNAARSYRNTQQELTSVVNGMGR